MRASALLLALLFWAAFLPNELHAQASDPATTAAARSLFERGATAADAGDHATAVDLLGRSLSLRPSPVVAFNLAQSLAQLGRLLEASEALVQAERDAVDATLREAAAALRAQLSARLAHLTVTVSPPDTDAEVRLDGAPLAAALLGTATPVDPGTHVASALREGVEVARVEATVAEAERGELSLVVPLATPIVEPVVEPPPAGDDTVLIVVLTSVGVLVVAGLGIGLGVGLSSQAGTPVEGNLSPGIVRFGP